jgi:RNA polymerase sigma-70 factor (TIGR02943 family)
LAEENSRASLNPSSWVRSFGDYLFSYALLKVGNRETAEDLVQDTFVSAIKAKDSFKGNSSEKTWLTSILKNKIIDHYRRSDVLRNASEYIGETDHQFSDHFFDKSNGHWLKASAPQDWPDREISNAEFDRVIQMCIHKMPSRLIPVFVAKFIDDEDSEIICKAHNISASNYWVMIHRAKVLIRSCLEKNWFLTKT